MGERNGEGRAGGVGDDDDAESLAPQWARPKILFVDDEDEDSDGDFYDDESDWDFVYDVTSLRWGGNQRRAEDEDKGAGHNAAPLWGRPKASDDMDDSDEDKDQEGGAAANSDATKIQVPEHKEDRPGLIRARTSPVSLEALRSRQRGGIVDGDGDDGGDEPWEWSLEVESA